MSDKLHGVTTFVQVVESGSFALAAERMNLTRSAVGKVISRLESRLGVRLLHRTTRSQSLTEDIEGGYADPNLSNEIRLAAQLIKQKQESERETLVFRNETTISGGQGMMTAIFGKEVSDRANAGPDVLPVMEAEVIKDSHDQ